MGTYVTMADLATFLPAVFATQARGYTMPGAVRPVAFTEQQEASVQRSYDLRSPPVGSSFVSVDSFVALPPQSFAPKRRRRRRRSWFGLRSG